MTDSILYAREGALAHLTFNRPASLNAMGFEMGQRWRDLAREITADPEVGAVLIDASGPAFCAGGDDRLVRFDERADAVVDDPGHGADVGAGRP